MSTTWEKIAMYGVGRPSGKIGFNAMRICARHVRFPEPDGRDPRDAMRTWLTRSGVAYHPRGSVGMSTRVSVSVPADLVRAPVGPSAPEPGADLVRAAFDRLGRSPLFAQCFHQRTGALRKGWRLINGIPSWADDIFAA